MSWNYLHRLEYRREYSRHHRVHVYTEHVEDHGFTFQRSSMTRAEWYAHYTLLCAEDFLERKAAAPGTYLVSVYREHPSGTVDLGTVRVRWAPVIG